MKQQHKLSPGMSNWVRWNAKRYAAVCNADKAKNQRSYGKWLKAAKRYERRCYAIIELADKQRRAAMSDLTDEVLKAGLYLPDADSPATP